MAQASHTPWSGIHDCSARGQMRYWACVVSWQANATLGDHGWSARREVAWSRPRTMDGEPKNPQSSRWLSHSRKGRRPRGGDDVDKRIAPGHVPTRTARAGLGTGNVDGHNCRCFGQPRTKLEGLVGVACAKQVCCLERSTVQAGSWDGES